MRLHYTRNTLVLVYLLTYTIHIVIVVDNWPSLVTLINFHNTFVSAVHTLFSSQFPLLAVSMIYLFDSGVKSPSTFFFARVFVERFSVISRLWERYPADGFKAYACRSECL